jgi:hypothetical protein
MSHESDHQLVYITLYMGVRMIWQGDVRVSIFNELMAKYMEK